MNTPNYTPVVTVKCVTYKTLPVSGLNIAYREAGDPANPNVALYPKWQAFLRERQPETIIFWAQDDISSLGREEKLICRICPRFTIESARLKVQFAEDAWSSRDPDRVALRLQKRNGAS
jgi:Protein of unknown function (DUF1348)